MRRSTTSEPTIVETLRQHASAAPARTAIRFIPAASAPIDLTFAALDAAATRLAGLLRSRVQPGDHILMFYPPGLDFVVAFFGVLYAGAVAVPLVPPRRQGAGPIIDALINNAEPAAILTSSHLLARVGHILSELRCSLQPLATDTAIIDTEPGDIVMPSRDAACVLQYTSGSTGTPRGVVVTHGNVARNARLLATQTALTQQSVWVSWVPHFHDLGLFGGLCTPLYAGITSVLMPPAAFVARPVRWLEAIAQNGGTVSIAPNFAYDLCLQEIDDADCAGLDLSRWAVAGCGALHAGWTVNRINHSVAYSLNDACTNQAESFFSRLRRMIDGQHHTVSPQYLHQYATHAAWIEDNRRMDNGALANRALGLALAHSVSRNWKGYWQR
jgi:acyl-CoA synthetase (AMP-forming)/AMP-acid ligase II